VKKFHPDPVIELPIRDGNQDSKWALGIAECVIELPIRDGNLSQKR